MNNKALHTVAFVLLVVGGLNWLLVGAFNMNLVATLLGEGSTFTKVVYILVGVSALYEIVTHKGHCSSCST